MKTIVLPVTPELGSVLRDILMMATPVETGHGMVGTMAIGT